MWDVDHPGNLDCKKEEISYVMQYPYERPDDLLDRDKYIHILRVEGCGEQKGILHFLGAHDIGRILHKDGSLKAKMLPCRHCWRSWKIDNPKGRKALEDHEHYCMHHYPAQLNLPKDGNHHVVFKNDKYKQRQPFVFIADFEAFNMTAPGILNSFRRMAGMQTAHIVSGAKYVIIGPHGKVYRISPIPKQEQR